MLTIITEKEDHRWLNYIVEEFKRINIAQFKINVRHVNQTVNKDANVIYYISQSNNTLSIPDRSDVPIQKNIKWLQNDLFVLKGTLVRKWNGLCNYDILWNAFVFLSRLEEYLEENNNKINSYSARHPRLDKNTFDIPIVNILFNELEKLIKKYFPSLKFGEKRKPKVEFSHDVDYIRKTIQLRIKQTAFNGYNVLKSILNIRKIMGNLKKAIFFLFSDTPYWCFEYWKTLEKRYSVRSVFYIFLKTGKNNIISWLLDPSYNIRTNKALQIQVKELVEEGFKIGLHGSIRSAVDEKQLRDEKKMLEEIIGRPVNKIRQHWLNYDENTTPGLHEKYFKYDSTIGWNDRIGFRSGCACQHRHYNHSEHRSYNYWITPQVVMDSVIFDYGSLNPDQQIKKAQMVISDLKKYKTSHISISWHQRTCSKDYEWQKTYEMLLKEYIKTIE